MESNCRSSGPEGAGRAISSRDRAMENGKSREEPLWPGEKVRCWTAGALAGFGEYVATTKSFEASSVIWSSSGSSDVRTQSVSRTAAMMASFLTPSLSATRWPPPVLAEPERFAYWNSSEDASLSTHSGTRAHESQQAVEKGQAGAFLPVRAG